MSEPWLARTFFSLTLMTMGVNGVGWYGLWRYYVVTLGGGNLERRSTSRGSKAVGVITRVIRLEFAYYLLLFFYQFLANRPLSTFWVIFMFLYHLLGFLGNEHYRGWGNSNGRSWISKRKMSVLLSTIVTLDLVEFYVLITFSHRLYLLGGR